MNDLNALTLPQLAHELLDSELAMTLLALAHNEDTCQVGDITTASIIEPDRHASGVIVARQAGVVAGLAVVQRYLTHVGMAQCLELLAADGDSCAAGQALARMNGSLRDLLLHERPVLNFLGRLCGIASYTQLFVRAVADSNARIFDTRKTTPGLRAMEKYAVRCGGGMLHRIGLYDAALYKDNHLAHFSLDELATRLAAAATTVRQVHDVQFVEVEVDSLQQLQQVLSIEPGLIDIVLLDNMSNEQLIEAVAMRNECSSKVQLEASGGVSLENISSIAHSGVQRIAIGGLTHHATWLDIAMDIEVRDG